MKTPQVRSILSTSDGSQKLALQPSVSFETSYTENPKIPVIHLDEKVRYQKIEGFGGAFTEAAAVTLQKLPKAKQEEILQAYFHPKKGHGYTLCRTHINSCDFALGNYAYCEKEGDLTLSTFSIDRDRLALIPMIKRAQAICGKAMKLLASPWSPPAWMKTTGKMNEGGKLKPEYRGVWARYYTRYIREYKKEGIPIWGLTVQNEPMATQTWDSCIYTAEEERDFVRDHLGPTLHREKMKNVKLIIWDHNRDWLYDRSKTIFEDKKASKFVWGAGFHWYGHEAFDNVQRVHDAWPDKKLIFTEGCQEFGPHLGSPLVGERYARSLIHDMNRWTAGFIDWNLLLDTTGGPNHVGNFCSAPILVDPETKEVHYQSSFYYIGHFSKFIKPNATRILSSSSHDKLEITAAQNPDKSIVLIVLNREDRELPFVLKFKKYSISLRAPAHSIQTFVIPSSLK
ncbi:MAG: glycoside hydrolase family 30 beta sandwich domain-containing protein [Verrucomicrobiota bacterium]